MSVINLVGHGLTAGQRVAFSGVAPMGTGIDETYVYYILSAGLTTDAFQISETNGGTPLTLAFNITFANMQVIPETPDSDPWAPAYTAVDDPADVQAPPDILDQPGDPVPTSSTVSGIIRLFIELPTYSDPASRVRLQEVQVTHAFSSGQPVWESATLLTFPRGTNTMTVPALPSTLYNVRSRVQDVFGNYSIWSPIIAITSDAGFDSMSPVDGSVGTTTIKDGAITTVKLKARSVTADILAATIVLASLIKTKDTGRRVEIDEFGIRLFDASEVMMVNIPTNGDAVYIRGDLTANTLISNSSATLYGVNTFPGSSVTTLANGISAPTSAPNLAASLDSLSLTSTPADVSTAAGIGYDSAAGTFWIAADPTAAGDYVAHEYSASTGGYVRSISATGSTTTTTTTLGSTSHVADTTQAYSGTSESQIGTPLVMPRAGRITKVHAYLAGYSGSANCRMAIWNTSGTSLKEGGNFTAASRTFSNGNDLAYESTFSTPLDVASGVTIWAGFLHTSSSEGFFYSRDDGSGKTTKRGDGLAGSMTGISTDSATKPNIYITYEYDVDTRLETAPNVGIATDGTYIYTLDNTGVIWKYLRSDGSYVAKSAVLTDISGTKSKAGLFFYNAGTPLLVVTTTTGTGAGVQPKIVQVTPATLVVQSTFTTTGGPTFSGTTDTFRGGHYLVDPLNSNIFTFWIATTNAVHAYTYTGGAVFNWTANRDFSVAAYSSAGLTHDGTQFRGWSTSSATKVWKFSNWDWTTSSSTYWIGYSWYDSAGTTHETACGPRSSIVMRRREQVTVTNASIPTGGAEDPNGRRVYFLPGAGDFSPGAAWLQDTGNYTSRILNSYTASGTHDGAGTAFPAGSPAELKSAGGTWSLKGDGTFIAAKMPTALPVKIVASGDDTCSTSVRDIPGATTTFTPTEAETCVVVGVWEYDTGTVGSTSCYGRLMVDSTAQSENARYRGMVDHAGDAVQTWVFTLTANASHTIKMQHWKSAAVGTITAKATNTGFTLFRFKT